jgi:lysophospholipase L1-like esterase
LKTHNLEQKPRGILTRDGVHLNPQGNRLVADEMLGALGVKAAQ